MTELELLRAFVAQYELEGQLDTFRLDRTGKRPARWAVGDRVLFIRSGGDWGPQKGWKGRIESFREPDRDVPGDQYQVFYVIPDNEDGTPGDRRNGIFWTTPDDVILAQDPKPPLEWRRTEGGAWEAGDYVCGEQVNGAWCAFRASDGKTIATDKLLRAAKRLCERDNQEREP